MADPTNNPYPNRPTVADTTSGTSGGTIAAIVIAALVVVGLLFWALSGDTDGVIPATEPAAAVAPDAGSVGDTAPMDVAPEGGDALDPMVPAPDAGKDVVPLGDAVPPADDTTP
jgi:hypothetical protein